MPKPDAETETLRKEVQGLADKIREEQKKALDTQDFGPASPIPRAKAVVRKNLKGHINKVLLLLLNIAVLFNKFL